MTAPLHDILSPFCDDSHDLRSDVEYLFDQLEEPTRSALPGAEAQMPVEAAPCDPALTVLGVPDTSLIDDDTPAEALRDGWELVLLSQTIGATFHALLTDMGASWEAERAAKEWMVMFLHSGEDARYIQAGCELLAGVLESLLQARTGAPARWWPGKRGQLTDPRIDRLGAWYLATSPSGREWRVRKASEVSIQAVSVKSGHREILHREEAKARFTLHHRLA